MYQVPPTTSPSASAADPDAAFAVRGDIDAALRFWNASRGWVTVVLMAHRPRGSDLDDLLQDVAAAFFRGVTTVRDPAALRGWLRRVAINAARADGRTVRRRPRAIDPAMGHHGLGGPPESNGGNEARGLVADLEARLERLPELYREPLLLRTVRGLSSRQVGDLLGISSATVDTRVARARRMLLEFEVKESAAPERADDEVVTYA